MISVFNQTFRILTTINSLLRRKNKKVFYASEVYRYNKYLHTHAHVRNIFRYLISKGFLERVDDGNGRRKSYELTSEGWEAVEVAKRVKKVFKEE